MARPIPWPTRGRCQRRPSGSQGQGLAQESRSTSGVTLRAATAALTVPFGTSKGTRRLVLSAALCVSFFATRLALGIPYGFEATVGTGGVAFATLGRRAGGSLVQLFGEPSRWQAVVRRGASSPGFFPASPVEEPTGPVADGDLAEENRQLREQLAVLIDEIRLLREVLEEVPLDSTSAVDVATAPAPQSPAPAPAPAPSAVPPTVSFPTFPAQAPAPAPASLPPFPSAPAGSIPPFPVAAPVPVPVPTPSAPFSSSLPSVPKPKPGVVSAKVVSAGHDCGNDAAFYIDDRKVPITGSANRRGLNVVVMDDETGKVLSAKTYDIWGFPGDENKRLAADVKALQDGLYVFAALKDSGMENLDSSGLQALRSCGAEIEGRLGVRQSYALIGVKGGEAIMERSGTRMMMLESKLDVSAPAPKAPFTGGFASSPTGRSSRSASFPDAVPSSRVAPEAPPPSPVAAAAAQAGKPLPFPEVLPPSAAPPPAATNAVPPRTVATGPKIDVDPRGQVTIDKGTTLSHDGKTWEEVLVQLEELEEQIKARRLAGAI